MSALTVVLMGCGPAAETQGETLAATVGTQSVGLAAHQKISIPEFDYVEDQDLQATRELSIFDNLGRAERFKEDLHSDGSGEIALSILEYAGLGLPTWSQPDSQLESSYFNRQRYLVKYRDLHLGSEISLQRNFRWSEQPGVVQVAGLDCKRIFAESVHGLGNFEFLVTVDTDLLLGWTSFDVQGDPVMRMKTLDVDFTPDHNGVAWAVPAVAEHPYAGPVDEPLLGFAPQSPQYVPPGFYGLEERLLLANGIMANLGNIHAALYSDGIHMLFVAQQKTLSTPALNVLSGAVLVKHADIGGIRVAEGDLPGRRVYVVSQLPSEELQTIFGSLF
ncbi:MAG: hypothetical protein GY747_08035 [Planctomycetes bacterium]|nr:hypothetical protein [Planctomycetota bacterium]MCP4771131.1 hypothetical protein [Planctomycetota bacterium]MCP4862142.1 hypothetical protein [Planctomycetota bacterium]